MLTAEHAIVFGQFELRPAQRQLWMAGQPVRLGSRAMDILLALVERHGEVVSNDDLVSRVWPNTHVEPNNLRVHLTALRKALSADPTQAQVIANVPGRGYGFVGSLSYRQDRPEAVPVKKRVGNLPALLSRVVGREDIVLTLTSQCLVHRLLTIVGPGGIGKSTVALQVAWTLGSAFPDGIAHLDIASAPDPSYVAGLLAAALGRPAVSDDVLADLIDHIADGRVLIVLDGCEHLIDELAHFAESLLRGAANLAIIATSREPLRVQGEWVFRLPALPVPPAGGGDTAEALRQFPSVQLFVQAVSATLGGFCPNDDTAASVARNFPPLDGQPLALEPGPAPARTPRLPIPAAPPAAA
ncbi:winged helix-turn-helix domain-containing protein, partial [Nostoc sp. NIES-2111]